MKALKALIDTFRMRSDIDIAVYEKLEDQDTQIATLKQHIETQRGQINSLNTRYSELLATLSGIRQEIRSANR